jgi:hypothetical protein
MATTSGDTNLLFDRVGHFFAMKTTVLGLCSTHARRLDVTRLPRSPDFCCNILPQFSLF